jgi:hypothetical protein
MQAQTLGEAAGLRQKIFLFEVSISRAGRAHLAFVRVLENCARIENEDEGRTITSRTTKASVP